MNYNRVADELYTEARKLDSRIKLADAREEKLAQAARTREEELDELFTQVDNDPYLDRISDLVNRAIKRHSDLKWRRERLEKAAAQVEEVGDLIYNLRKTKELARQQRAQQAV